MTLDRRTFTAKNDALNQTFGATPPYREEDVTTDTWSSRTKEVHVRVTHHPSGCQGEATGAFRLETALRARHAMERALRNAGWQGEGE